MSYRSTKPPQAPRRRTRRSRGFLEEAAERRRAEAERQLSKAEQARLARQTEQEHEALTARARRERAARRAATGSGSRRSARRRGAGAAPRRGRVRRALAEAEQRRRVAQRQAEEVLAVERRRRRWRRGTRTGRRPTGSRERLDVTRGPGAGPERPRQEALRAGLRPGDLRQRWRCASARAPALDGGPEADDNVGGDLVVHEDDGWVAPAGFNFTRDVVEHFATDPRRTALTFVDGDGVIERRTFAQVAADAARWAHLLRGSGLPAG